MKKARLTCAVILLVFAFSVGYTAHQFHRLCWHDLSFVADYHLNSEAEVKDFLLDQLPMGEATWEDTLALTRELDGVTCNTSTDPSVTALYCHVTVDSVAYIGKSPSIESCIHIHLSYPVLNFFFYFEDDVLTEITIYADGAGL